MGCHAFRPDMRQGHVTPRGGPGMTSPSHRPSTEPISPPPFNFILGCGQGGVHLPLCGLACLLAWPYWKAGTGDFVNELGLTNIKCCSKSPSPERAPASALIIDAVSCHDLGAEGRQALVVKHVEPRPSKRGPLPIIVQPGYTMYRESPLGKYRIPALPIAKGFIPFPALTKHPRIHSLVSVPPRAMGKKSHDPISSLMLSMVRRRSMMV